MVDPLVVDNSKIKGLKPSKKSRYHQGYVRREQCHKLFESAKNEPIIYRSGLELQFINFCENNPKIVRWASEPIKIEYYSRLDQGIHNYYPDYIIENYKGERSIVEIKPYNQTIKPSPIDSRWAKEQWIKNVDKWSAAKKFADSNNMKFIIVTERFFK